MEAIPKTLQTLDWTVMVIYAVGMLLIGWYYSRRSKTSADYHLGGRQMKSWTVGLSLFASMLSAISYLSGPGELIKNGPIYWCGLIAHPFSFIIIGYLLIPAIMKQNVSSAYELLEKKLDRRVRILASLFFLTLRITWMAVIIYMTAQKVIVPVMGWGENAALWVSIAVGVITLIYTSMGGLRAVVATDVIQTFILFLGAGLTVAIVTYKLGGVSAWIPDQWQDHWEKLTFFDPERRASIGVAFLAMSTWWIFTAGADQIAIQRYLATRDAKTARRAIGTSLICDATVSIFLVMVGLSLMAYFKQFGTELIPGESIQTCADRIFPTFIVKVLPPGVSGLVIAGLLAAAMSSLSSGVNSSCLVISRDLLSIGTSGREAENRQVLEAKWISFIVGVVVIILCLILSFLMKWIKGNLFEMSFKCINLLVAPLFVPFFMALLIRRASGTGTLIGMIAAVTTAALISFSKEIFGYQVPFLWSMPGSFVAGAIVSTLASFIFPKPMSHSIEAKEN